MGMTIDEAIEELESTKDYPASDPASDEALDFAIAIMRKYQKIKEIMAKRPKDMISSNPTLRVICEVLEDGND